MTADSNESIRSNSQEDREDGSLEKKEKRKKARLRTRGPYRKAHANW